MNRTSSTPTTNEPPPEPSRFDPEKFRKQLIWHESLAKQNLTPEIAESLAIGYHPQRKRIFYASRHPSGEIAGFRDDTGKPPPQWLPASTTVVKFPKRA